MLAREGSRKLQALSGMHRTAIVNRLADLLLERQSDILAANQQDVQEAFAEGIFVFCMSTYHSEHLRHCVYGFERFHVNENCSRFSPNTSHISPIL